MWNAAAPSISQFSTANWNSLRFDAEKKTSHTQTASTATGRERGVKKEKQKVHNNQYMCIFVEAFFHNTMSSVILPLSVRFYIHFCVLFILFFFHNFLFLFQFESRCRWIDLWWFHDKYLRWGEYIPSHIIFHFICRMYVDMSCFMVVCIEKTMLLLVSMFAYARDSGIFIFSYFGIQYSLSLSCSEGRRNINSASDEVTYSVYKRSKCQVHDKTGQDKTRQDKATVGNWWKSERIEEKNAQIAWQMKYT